MPQLTPERWSLNHRSSQTWTVIRAKPWRRWWCASWLTPCICHISCWCETGKGDSHQRDIWRHEYSILFRLSVFSVPMRIDNQCSREFTFDGGIAFNLNYWFLWAPFWNWVALHCLSWRSYGGICMNPVWPTAKVDGLTYRRWTGQAGHAEKVHGTGMWNCDCEIVGPMLFSILFTMSSDILIQRRILWTFESSNVRNGNEPMLSIDIVHKPSLGHFVFAIGLKFV